MLDREDSIINYFTICAVPSIGAITALAASPALALAVTIMAAGLLIRHLLYKHKDALLENRALIDQLAIVEQLSKARRSVDANDGLQEKSSSHPMLSSISIYRPELMLSRAPTILVVEDCDSVRNGVKLLLEDYGAKVVCAANGQEALRHFFDGLRPDLILLNLMMPIMDGHQFLAAREAVPELKTTPVVVMTAWGGRDPDVVDRSDAWLQNPFSFQQLLETVKNILNRRIIMTKPHACDVCEVVSAEAAADPDGICPQCRGNLPSCKTCGQNQLYNGVLCRSCYANETGEEPWDDEYVEDEDEDDDDPH